MARTKNGVPTKGHIGGWSYFEREGEAFVRISTNLVAKDRPITRARAEQLSKMSNLVHAWRSFRKGLKGCFENKKPAATDYSGFLAANLPWARVFLPKGPEGNRTVVADNFYVSYGSLQPPIEVEESGEWMLSDIGVGNGEVTPDTKVGSLAESIVSQSDGAFQPMDELIFVRMEQIIGFNSRLPEVRTEVNRLVLNPGNRRTLEQEFAYPAPCAGFQVVDGRLAAPLRRGDLVAWIRLRRDKTGRPHVTTQRLVGSNPRLAQYMGKEAIEEALGSYHLSSGYYDKPTIPQIEIATSSNDVALGVVEGGGIYAPGAPVTLRAVEREGRFLVWDDGCQDPVRQMAALNGGSFKAIFVRK